MHEMLRRAIEAVYTPAGLAIEGVTPEAESEEYGAHRFRLDGEQVIFRVAKTTPKKIGQFVTLWKRPKPGEKTSAPGNKPAPLHVDDEISFVIIHVHDDRHRGQFIFPSSILLAKGIMANHSKKGKTAFRIYPPWTKPQATDAMKSQKWQASYFFPIDDGGHSNPEKVRSLFGKSS